MAMSVLDVRVLGPFVVLRAGQTLPLGRSKQRDLLALLAAHAPDAVSPDTIVEELWQGSAPPSARKVVQKHVSELRQMLGRPHVASLPGGYALRDVAVDSAIFATAYEQARSDEPTVVCERLTDALAMWRGEPYADVDLDGLGPTRARLSELRIAAIEHLNEARLSLGVFTPLIADLERLTVEHPVREGLWSQLMRALYGAGRQSDALRAYQRLRGVLARELGIEPSGELRQLEQRILAQDPELAPTSRPDEDVDFEGAHRRVMTVIAVDLDDAVGVDPEDRARSMKAAVEQIRAWCDAENGTIESAMGSRLLIAFGAPAHEDDADRAVHLANHIVTELPTAKASLATGWALVQPDPEPGAHIVGSVVEVACSALATAPRGTAHVDHSTTAARSRPIEDPPFVGPRARADHCRRATRPNARRARSTSHLRARRTRRRQDSTRSRAATTLSSHGDVVARSLLRRIAAIGSTRSHHSCTCRIAGVGRPVRVARRVRQAARNTARRRG